MIKEKKEGGARQVAEVFAYARRRTMQTGIKHAVMAYKPTQTSAWRYYAVATTSRFWMLRHIYRRQT